MPFQSKAQARYLHARKPEGVDLSEWDRTTKKKKGGFAKLPERVDKGVSQQFSAGLKMGRKAATMPEVSMHLHPKAPLALKAGALTGKRPKAVAAGLGAGVAVPAVAVLHHRRKVTKATHWSDRIIGHHQARIAHHQAQIDRLSTFKRPTKKVTKRLPGETKTQAVTRHQRQLGGLFTTAAAVPAILGVRAGIRGAQMASGAEKAAMATRQLQHGATAIGLGAIGSGISAAPVPKRLFTTPSPKRAHKPRVKSTGITSKRHHRRVVVLPNAALQSHRKGAKPAPGYDRSGVGKADEGVNMSVDAWGIDRPDLEVGKAFEIPKIPKIPTKLPKLPTGLTPKAGVKATKDVGAGLKSGFAGAEPGKLGPAGMSAHTFGGGIRAHPISTGLIGGGGALAGGGLVAGRQRKPKPFGKAEFNKAATKSERVRHYGAMAGTTGTLGATAGAVGAGAGLVGHLESKGHDPMGFTARDAPGKRALSGAAKTRVLKPMAASHAYQAKTLGALAGGSLALSAAYKYKQRQAKLGKAGSIGKASTRQRRADTASSVGLGAASAGLGHQAVSHGLYNAKFLNRQADAATTSARGAHALITGHNTGHWESSPEELGFAAKQRRLGLRVASVKKPAAGLAAGAALAGGAGMYELGRHALASHRPRKPVVKSYTAPPLPAGFDTGIFEAARTVDGHAGFVFSDPGMAEQ